MSYEPKRCAGPDCNRIGVPQDREQVSRKLAAEVRKGIRAYLDAYKGHVTDEIVAEIRSELDQLREAAPGPGRAVAVIGR